MGKIFGGNKSAEKAQKEAAEASARAAQAQAQAQEAATTMQENFAVDLKTENQTQAVAGGVAAEGIAAGMTDGTVQKRRRNAQQLSSQIGL